MTAPAIEDGAVREAAGPVRYAASPVREAVRVTRPGGIAPDPQHARTEIRIDASEPVFAGHYPDFPIFPGVCVVECVHKSALATAPDGAALTLAALDSARFLGAVFPGDVLGVDVTWTTLDDGWKCTAVASTDRGVAAKVRLRYRTGGSA